MDLFDQNRDDSQEESQELAGCLVRIYFENAESGFGAGQFQLDEGGDRISVRGRIAGLREGQPIRIQGHYEVHPRFGRQFQIDELEVLRPEGRGALLAYLSSGLIKGVGPALAERIVDHLGESALELIEEAPEQLEEVPGIGPTKAREIQQSVSEQMGLREVLLFLHGHGLPTGLASRILEAYGKDAPRLLQANPYRLAEDMVGVGFKRADEVAKKLGIPPESEERRKAALLHTLGQAVVREGQVYLPRAELLRRAGELIGQPAEVLEGALQQLAETRRVVPEQAPGLPVLTEGEDLRIYPLAMHIAESNLAQGLDALCTRRDLDLGRSPGQLIEAWQRGQDLTLPEGQRAALEVALQKPCAVMTGGPGVGKTTIIRALCEILERHGARVALAAPTGRAAKRMSEATDRPASTLHRLLEFQAGTGRFQRNEHSHIEADLVVVDESSMLDLMLAYHLVKAIGPGTRILFVGDVDQLPSVGAGCVLADMIGSGRLPVARLTQIFRQARGSLIVENAYRILRGEMPRMPEGEQGLSDFYFIETREASKGLDTLCHLVGERIPEAFGLHPMRDVQVLAPMYRGTLGVDEINRRLQDLLIPGGTEILRGSRRFREGDKVLQVRNDYDLELFNGDPGRIERIDLENGKVHVAFGKRHLPLDLSQLDDLVPAYAITVHRAQGSEYPAVIVALDRGHHLLLNRRLLYTAVTRARQLLILVGSRAALESAIANDRESLRLSGLRDRLAALAVGDGIHPRAADA